MTKLVSHQAAIYLAVGIVVYVIDLTIYTLMIAGMPELYLGASGVGKLVGAASGFVLHKRFTFSWRQRDESDRQLISYVVLFLINLALSSGLLWLSVDRFGIDKLPARIVVDAFQIILSFLVMRAWVFRSI